MLEGIKKDYGLKKWNLYSSGQQAEIILKKGYTHSIASRALYVSNNKVQEKASKLKLAARSDTGKFAQMLLYVRRQMRHRGIKLIEPGDPEWFTIKELTKLATEFCNEFQLSLKDGYQIYLRTGISKVKNFSINKLKSLHQAIFDHYEATQVIEMDKTPRETEELHDFYMANISDKTGFSQGYKNIPEKYRYFVEGKQEAKKLGVSYKVYIKAQFDAFEWNNSVPDPTQLVGTKALDRLQKYCFKEGLMVGKKKGSGIKWDKLKKLKHGDNS